MKPLHIIFLFICLIFNQYKASAQEDLLGLLNEVITSIKIQGYDGGKTDSWARVPYNFSDITIKDNILTINYSFKISDGGNHVNGKFVPNIYMHFYTIVIDIPKSILHRSTKEYWHSISISSSEGIKIIKSVKDQYNKETYYVDDWGIEVNSEALESKIYNAFNDIWNKNQITTQSSAASDKRTPASSSKPIQQYNQNTKLFENNYFSFRYPTSWDLASENGQKIDNNTPSVVIMKHRKNDYEFCPSVNVILGYKKINETPYSIAYNSYKVMKDIVPSAQLIGNVEKTELAGHQGAKVTVEFIMNGVHFRNTQYVIQIKNNIMLALTVGLEAENFIEQQKVTNEILQTLKIK